MPIICSVLTWIAWVHVYIQLWYKHCTVVGLEKITNLMVEVSHLVLCKLVHANITLFTGLTLSLVPKLGLNIDIWDVGHIGLYVTCWAKTRAALPVFELRRFYPCTKISRKVAFRIRARSITRDTDFRSYLDFHKMRVSLIGSHIAKCRTTNLCYQSFSLDFYW